MIQSIKVIVTRRDDENPKITRQNSAEETNPSHGHYDQAVTDLLHHCLRQRSAESPVETATASKTRLATEKQIRAIEAIAKNQGFDLRRHLQERQGATEVCELTVTQASNLIDHLKSRQSA